MFTTCANGHDLTVDNAFIYKSNGSRECRECNPKVQKTRRKQRLGTWTEKMGKTRDVYS